MSIFDVKFDTLDVRLNVPIWETVTPYELKYKAMKSIINMVETHGKLILGYSGGMDSGFILCCVKDLLQNNLIYENQIEIASARYLINGEVATLDFDRSQRFAKSLGFNPRIDDLELDEKFLLECMEWGARWKIPDVVSLTQILWRMRQPHVVIKGVATPGYGYSRDMNPMKYLLRMTSSKMSHHIPENNSIDIWDYDSDVFSALCSPYWLKKRDIDYEPFENKYPGNPFNPIAFNERLPKIMLILQCYPELTALFFKFSTFNNFFLPPILREAIKYYNSKFPMEECTTNVCLPNGKSFYSLKEVEDYFVS